MHYPLRWFFIIVLFTVALSEDSLSPGPTAYVIRNSTVTFRCSSSDKWSYLLFRDYGIQDGKLNAAVFQQNTTYCRPIFTQTAYGEGKYLALPCYDGEPVSTEVRYINMSYHNKTLGCIFDGRVEVLTTIKIREMLTNPNINPSGFRTVEEKKLANFSCTAISIPKSSIIWYLNGTIVMDNAITSSLTEKTVISTLTYRAKKEDNNMQVYCSANDTFTTLKSSAANLNIEYIPTIHIEPNYDPLYLYEDQKNVVLRCVVNDANPRNGITYIWTYHHGIVENNTVSITTVSMDTEGQYSCKALNTVGPSEIISKEVYVQYGPLIRNFDTSITEGMNLSLKPSVAANPFPSYFWWTRQNDTDFNDNGTTLIIKEILRKSSGYYIYHVTNTLRPSGNNAMNRTSQKISYIDVQFIPDIHMEPDYDPYILYEQQRHVVLTCVVDEANPSTDIRYQWNHTGGTITQENITISTIEISHKGSYSCIAKNQVGSSFPIYKQLVVQYGPSISNISYQEVITEGNDLVLYPIIDAYPLVNVIWWSRHGNANFEHDGPVLKIKNIHRHDSGNYSCHATNTLTPSGETIKNRTDILMFFINVQYPPSIEITGASSLKVLENDNITVHCKVKDANPIISSLSWYHNTTNLFANSANYTITNTKRSDAGSYICDARNEIGNGLASIYINVLYGPGVTSLVVVNGSTVWENATVAFKCEIDSNPISMIKWTFNDKHLEDNVYVGKVSYYNILATTCFHTGTYSCLASNTIFLNTYNTSKDVQLFVNCSPRLNIYMKQPPSKIGLPFGGILDLNVYIVAYPILTVAEWNFTSTFQYNFTNVMKGNLESNSFRHTSQLYKSNMSEYDFGDYTLHVQNNVGSMTLLFKVVPEGPPEPSSLTNATCGIQKVLLYWVTSFSGGATQTFSVIIVSKETRDHIQTDVSSSVKGEIKHTSLDLSPGNYTFSILGENIYNSAVSTTSMSCQVKGTSKTGNTSMVAAAAGGGVGTAVILIGAAIMILYFIKRRRKLNGEQLETASSSRKLTEEDTDDGLKDNPLYVTSQCDNIENSQIYSQVNKTMKSKEFKKDQRLVKTSKATKNIDKASKHEDMEMGSVYENSDETIKAQKTDEIYANTENDTLTKQNQHMEPKKNKDGLIYAELDIAPSGTRFVIRGIENRNNYAIIDLSKTAEPLPSDDEDDDQDKTKDES